MRTRMIMDMAQASIYGQANKEGRNTLWEGWARIINKVQQSITLRDMNPERLAGSTIMWNGEAKPISYIKQQFARLFGRRSVER